MANDNRLEVMAQISKEAFETRLYGKEVAGALGAINLISNMSPEELEEGMDVINVLLEMLKKAKHETFQEKDNSSAES